MNVFTVKKIRKNHKISELFLETKLDKRIAKSDWVKLGGDRNRWYYILNNSDVQLTNDEEMFFAKFFDLEATQLYSL